MAESNSQYTANIEPPLLCNSADAINWDDVADVVVVGFGGAGVVAALQAIEAGGSVIAVDRFNGGGATEKSGGVIYAGGTPHQRNEGFEDSPEEMFNYLKGEGTPVRDETLQRFCNNSADDIAWLENHGVEFGGNTYHERIAYPPDGYYLYYTGMEKFRNWAKPAPRGHRTVGKGATGRFYYAPLKRSALKKGVRFHPHSPARRLIIDGNDNVIGIEVQQIPADRQVAHQKIYKKVDPYKIANGKKAERAIAEARQFEASVQPISKRYRATKGVILAAGGYNYNLEMFGHYRPIVKKAYRELVRGGSMGCDGSGIELGTTAGGALSHMDQLFCTKGISPPNAFVHGVLVNMEGRRFISEDAYAGNVGCAISEQSQDGAAWLILDSATFWEGARQLVWPLKNIWSWWGLPALLNVLFAGTKRAKSLQDLACKLGIDKTSLENTIGLYNQNAAKGTDPAQNKLQEYVRPLNKPPYYAINFCIRNLWGFSGTMPYGGLTVDEASGLVTRKDGTPIQGLYAAGRTAVGICSESNFSGLSIADTVFSGRRAARHAMQNNAP